MNTTIQSSPRSTHPGAITASWRADFNGASAAIEDLITVKDLESLQSGSSMLIVTRGPNTGAQFRLDKPVTSAGPHQLSDLYLDDITVSRRHAEIRCEKGTFSIVDCGSFNNTYVNGEPVESAVLANGDELQIGKFRLMFITG